MQGIQRWIDETRLSSLRQKWRELVLELEVQNCGIKKKLEIFCAKQKPDWFEALRVLTFGGKKVAESAGAMRLVGDDEALMEIIGLMAHWIAFGNDIIPNLSSMCHE